MIRRLFVSALFCLPVCAADPPPPYLEQLVRKAEQSFVNEVPDKDAWLANRARYRQELKEMLGLDPEPARGDLKPVITGVLTADGIVVEKLHFQSLPGLYVTANFYRPAGTSGKFPTILYLSGHGGEMGADGRSNGNKTHYQHHGIWFARHGYTCLILDTVQWGEILGEHHGTYKLNRWWWTSRGYTPAGVETWAGVRALDYIATRPEVDMDRIGVTGRSGGGAYSWFVTAMDDRIKVSAPTAGITTLRDHAINGVISGHCDCMYMTNLYGWDFDKLAALAAPRPLLISNTDKDDIFPLGGVMRIYDSTRRLYKMLDAEKNIGLQIAEGPHKDTQPLHAGAFHWFERFLKGADTMALIAEAAVPVFKKDDLRVFADLPKDEINTRIDESFVPVAAPPPVPETREQWTAMRDQWLSVIRDKILQPGPEPGDDLFSAVAFDPNILATAPQFLRSDFLKSSVARLVVNIATEVEDLPVKTPERFSMAIFPAGAASRREFRPLLESPHEYRAYTLSGAAPDKLRCTETVKICEALKKAGKLDSIQGRYSSAGVALLAELQGGIGVPLQLSTPTSSFSQGPFLPGILKHMDMPQVVAMAAERTKVRIAGRREDWAWALQTAERMGFGSNLEIVPAMEVLEVRKIWDAAPHNAFTSLTKYRDEWLVTFRESTSHVPGTDGAVRVLASKDGTAWESVALLTEPGVDLRDPKFCTAPDGRLMLTIGGSVYDGISAPGEKRKRTGARTRTCFSSDGRTWTAVLPACDDGQWLWRSTVVPAASGGPASLYGVAYTTAPDAKFRLSLWNSPDGLKFNRVTGLDPGRGVLPNETTLRCLPDGTLLALTRNENKAAGSRTMWGASMPPYTAWSWTDTGLIIHGPDFIVLSDGRMIYGGRDYVDGKPNMTLGFLTRSGTALPQVILPSGGDCSYPGIAAGPDGQIFVSYYSSHEGKAAIYFARINATLRRAAGAQ